MYKRDFSPLEELRESFLQRPASFVYRGARHSLTGLCLLICIGCHSTTSVTTGAEVGAADARLPASSSQDRKTSAESRDLDGQAALDEQIAIAVSEPIPVRELLVQLCEVRFPNQCQIDTDIEAMFDGELPLQPLRTGLDALCRVGRCQWKMTAQPPGLVIVRTTTADR